MPGKAKHYFANGNTAVGAYSLYESAFQGMRHIFILTGGPGTGKSTIIGHIARNMLENGRDVQLFHSPDDSDTLDGLIVTALRLAVVDGNACKQGLPESSKALIKYVDLGKAVDKRQLSADKERLFLLERKVKETYDQAYDTFARALRIHDEWETYYIGNIVADEADRIAGELTESLLGDRRFSKRAAIRHLFLGAATPRGAVDFIPNLTSDANRRIFVKGRPGSGKSTMLKKLAAAAEERGIDVEVFHCGFDPGSLDMLIFPELGAAIFDSTAPHEHFPERAGDETVDMYERAILPGTDEKYAEPLAGIQARYKQTMREATAYLAKAKEQYDQIRNIYTSATNFAIVEKMRQQLQEDIERLAQRYSPIR